MDECETEWHDKKGTPKGAKGGRGGEGPNQYTKTRADAYMSLSARVQERGAAGCVGRGARHVALLYPNARIKIWLVDCALTSRGWLPTEIKKIVRGRVERTEGVDTRQECGTQPKRVNKPYKKSRYVHDYTTHVCTTPREPWKEIVNRLQCNLRQTENNTYPTCLEIAMAPGLSQCSGRCLSHRSPSHTYLSCARTQRSRHRWHAKGGPRHRVRRT